MRPTSRVTLSRLAARSCLVGALGDDEAGDLIAGPLVAEARIDGRFVREAHHPTTTKVRYMSGGQQIMRLDIERPFSLTAGRSTRSATGSPAPRTTSPPSSCPTTRKASFSPLSLSGSSQ